MEKIDTDQILLNVGQEVSAKFKGAFCEAKIKSIEKCIKCKITFKKSGEQVVLNDKHIKGQLKIGACVEARKLDTDNYELAIINKIQDQSLYTVIFNDDDEKTLRRSFLRLKGDRHFLESETLNNSPLTHPEHFLNPVKSSHLNDTIASTTSTTNNSIKSSILNNECETSFNNGDLFNNEFKFGSVIVVEKKTIWYPAIILKSNSKKDSILVRSFRDNQTKYVRLSNISEYNSTKLLNERKNDPLIKELVDKVNKYISTGESIKCETQESNINTNSKTNEQDIQSLESSVSISDRSDDVSISGCDDNDEDNILNTSNENNTSSNGNSSNDDDDNDNDDNSDLDEDEKNQLMERKDRFIAQLYKFMDDRDTPLNKLPIINNIELDLYKLFSLVKKLGGYKKVNKLKKWSYVYKKMNLSQTTSTYVLSLKNSYKKYLQPYEEFYKKLGSAINDSISITTSIRVSTDSQRSLHLFKNRVNKQSQQLNKRETIDEQQKQQVVDEEKEEEEITVASLLNNNTYKTKQTTNKKIKLKKTTQEKLVGQKSNTINTNKQKLKLNLKSRINVFEKQRKLWSKRRKITLNTKLKKMKKISSTKSTSSETSSSSSSNECKSLKRKPTTQQKEQLIKKSVDQMNNLELETNELLTAKQEMINQSSIDLLLVQDEHDNETVKSEGQFTIDDISINKLVEVKYGDGKHRKHYHAKIIKIDSMNSSLFVHYTGWNNRYDEWININRITKIFDDDNYVKRHRKSSSNTIKHNKSNKQKLKTNDNEESSSTIDKHHHQQQQQLVSEVAQNETLVVSIKNEFVEDLDQNAQQSDADTINSQTETSSELNASQTTTATTTTTTATNIRKRRLIESINDTTKETVQSSQIFKPTIKMARKEQLTTVANNTEQNNSIEDKPNSIKDESLNDCDRDDISSETSKQVSIVSTTTSSLSNLNIENKFPTTNYPSNLTGEDKIRFIEEQMRECRKAYLKLKEEIANIDRKRKKHRKKLLNKTNQIHSNNKIEIQT